VTGGALDIYRENLKALLRKHYSGIVAEHAVEPRNMCDMGEHNGFGIATSENGGMIAIWIKIEKGVVTTAAFTSDGETPTVAAGSIVTEMVKDVTVAQAQKLGQQEVLDALGGLPKDSQYGASLAVEALKLALDDYFN
jgi:NifU-like protein involved in Fe-S cluster formation